MSDIIIYPELNLTTWIIELDGSVTSPVTIDSPAWPVSLVCLTETLTGGTITSIVINGGSPVSTFIGETIPASISIDIDFVGLTKIELTF